MKKRLNYFEIDGAFGGSQDWFKNVVMHIGGCAAAAACDSCIYFAREFGRPGLYPYDPQHLTKTEYIEFSQKMKPYIKPRIKGVHKLEWYMEGMTNYLSDIGEHIAMEGFAGDHSFEEARNLVREQLDKEYPVPYLMLHHQNKEKYKDFIWHWFLVVGYEEAGEDLIITVATYGQATMFFLSELWNTGHEEKGGLIRYINL